MNSLRNLQSVTINEYFDYIKTCEFIALHPVLAIKTFNNFKPFTVDFKLDDIENSLLCVELIKSVMKREHLIEDDLYHLSSSIGRSLFAIEILKETGVSTHYLKQIIKQILQFENWNLDIEDILTHFLPLFIDESIIKNTIQDYINNQKPDINDKTINFHVGKIKKMFDVDIDPSLIKTYLCAA
jgi:hypothetical protein